MPATSKADQAAVYQHIKNAIASDKLKKKMDKEQIRRAIAMMEVNYGLTTKKAERVIENLVILGEVELVK